MRCAKCGTEAIPGKKFCAECGSPLSNRCSNCNADNAPGAKFCADCGSALGTDVVAEGGKPSAAEADGGVRIAPDVPAAHIVFDVTPARFITAIITENGVARAPFDESLKKLAAISSSVPAQ